MPRVLLQERKKRQQAGYQTGQRVGRRESQGQRCIVGAEVTGQRTVARAIPGVLPEVGTRERGAYYSTVPRGEGHH